MNEKEQALNWWQDEYENIVENAVEEFCNENQIEMIQEGRKKKRGPKKAKYHKKRTVHRNRRDQHVRIKGNNSYIVYWNTNLWRQFKYMGKLCNIQIFRTTRAPIPKSRFSRLSAVCNNLPRKALYRYLIKTYIEDGDEPSLTDLHIGDYESFMRKINYTNSVIKINYGGDIWVLGEFLDKSHSFCITFPRGIFLRKEPNQKKYNVKYGKDRPQYTFVEFYDGPLDLEDYEGFEDDDKFQ